MNSIQPSEAGRRVAPVERGGKRRVREDDDRDFADELARRLSEEPESPPTEDNEPDDSELPEDRVELTSRTGIAEEDSTDNAPPEIESGKRLDLKI